MKEIGFIFLIVISFFFDIVGFFFAKKYAGQKNRILLIFLFSNTFSIFFPLIFWMLIFRKDFYEQFFSLIFFLIILRIASFCLGSGKIIKTLWNYSDFR